jgi:hypothetical protein
MALEEKKLTQSRARVDAMLDKYVFSPPSLSPPYPSLPFSSLYSLLLNYLMQHFPTTTKAEASGSQSAEGIKKQTRNQITEARAREGERASGRERRKERGVGCIF